MNNGLSKRTQIFTGRGAGYITKGGSNGDGKRKSHSGKGIHPYMKSEFWSFPANRFWESPHHTEVSKEYFNGVHPV